MNKCLACILVVVLCMNAMIGSVMAQPCTNASAQVSTASEGMPCHEMDRMPSEADCDGLCLCAHVQAHNMYDVSSNLHLIDPAHMTERFAPSDDMVTASNAAPPRRPPKSSI